MTLEPSATTTPTAGPETAQRRAKYRLRFRKAGRLRLVSHHDLMHCFERMLRRAELPICTTQGFHPQPRVVFAQSLALGVIGSNEVVEMEMYRELPAAEVHDRLVHQAPPGLEFLDTRAISPKAGAQVRRAFYRLEVPAEHATNLAERCTELLAQTEAWIDRTRPRPRRLNLRPYVHRLDFSPPFLEMALWVTPNGSVRPEEVARTLGLEALLETGAYFERFHLELYDEVPADDREGPPAGLMQPPSGAARPSENTEPAPEPKSSGRHSTLISGPLSFDS